MRVRCFLLPPHHRAHEALPAIYPVAEDDLATLTALQRLFPAARELDLSDALARVSCRLRGEMSESDWYLLTPGAGDAARPSALLPLALAAVRVLVGTACEETSHG